MDAQTKLYKLLIYATLYASGVHFYDNVVFWDEYPEPTWLTPGLVTLLWLPLALAGHRAVDYLYAGESERSYPFVHAFVMGNWLSLGHYLYTTPATALPRINSIIFAQVALASLLFFVAIFHQYVRSRDTMRTTATLWLTMTAGYGSLIAGLELLWPAKYAYWWL